jgi:glycerol-3-phosphate dehydrogenase
MPRLALSGIDDREFDVVVVGGGAVGASATQHLTAAGYDVLLVDKCDFGAGSSSRSGRMLHCGLRYLEPGEGLAQMTSRYSPVWQYLADPSKALKGLRRAREAMHCRSELVGTMPERVRRKIYYMPLYKGGRYKPWHVNAAFRVLGWLGPGDLPLDNQWLSPAEAKAHPLLGYLREPEKLRRVASFREYRFEWPERIVMDVVLDAERMGATVRNYTPVLGMEREADGRWRIDLGDGADGGARAQVRTRLVINAAGMWIDRVNRLAGSSARRKITGTKGAHIMVRLPPECRALGIITEYRDGGPMYVYPWRDMHYVGPTDTLFTGDEDDLYATGEEIGFLIDEVNHLLPGLGLGRADICFTWAGVRPQTHDPNNAMGERGRVVHDLAADGMPGAIALSAGNIMTHRRSGADLTAAVRGRIAPSGAPRALSYAAKPFPDDEASPALLNHWQGAKLTHLRHAAAHEHPTSLADLLFRRVGAGWTGTMAREGARKAAETVADIMGWDEARIDREVADYHALIAHLHGVNTAGHDVERE